MINILKIYWLTIKYKCKYELGMVSFFIHKKIKVQGCFKLVPNEQIFLYFTLHKSIS